MATRKLLDQKAASQLLRRDGWTQSRGGKHVVKMIKPGRRPITLPHNRGESYGRGLSSAIVRQADLNATKGSRCISRSSSSRTDRAIGLRSPSSRDAFASGRTLSELSNVRSGVERNRLVGDHQTTSTPYAQRRSSALTSA